MPFTGDGVYNITNVDSGLMLDLSGNQTSEGNAIQGWEKNGTQAQEWIVKNQNHPGSDKICVTIQVSNEGDNGNGFFSATKKSQSVKYTNKAWIITLTNRKNNEYTMHFPLVSNELVLSIPNLEAEDPAVKLDNFNEGDSQQLWKFKLVKSFQ